MQKRRLKTLQKRRKNGALFFLVFKAPQNGDVGVIFSSGEGDQTTHCSVNIHTVANI